MACQNGRIRNNVGLAFPLPADTLHALVYRHPADNFVHSTIIFKPVLSTPLSTTGTTIPAGSSKMKLHVIKSYFLTHSRTFHIKFIDQSDINSYVYLYSALFEIFSK